MEQDSAMKCKMKCEMNCKQIVAMFGSVIVIVAVVVVVVLSVIRLSPSTKQFRATFTEKCEEFKKRQSCESILASFEKAYVGKEPCSFSRKDYDPFFNENPFSHPSNMTMLWSNTTDLVHNFTKKSDCFFTLEDTLPGYVLDDQKWCGKEGSKAMLNGDRDEPYDPDSVFASVEIPALQAGRVTQLKVILAAENQNDEKCTSSSLQKLKNDLKTGIGYSCQVVTRSQIKNCIKNNTPCDSCF